MKNKLLHICTPVIFSAGFFYIGWYTHQPIPILGINVSETARLRIDGEELKIITNTYSTNRNFVFLDVKYGTGAVVGTLSVSNGWGDSPSYRIVNGHTHDWLVVTRYESGGTGFLTYSDEWYILGWSFDTKKVWSYSSQGNEVLGIDGVKNRYWSTNIINVGYADDSAVDVKLIEKSCTPTKNGGEKDCLESSHTDHYLWNADIEEFVLEK